MKSLEATSVYVSREELTFQGFEQDCFVVIYVVDHVGPNSYELQFILVLFGGKE